MTGKPKIVVERAGLDEATFCDVFALLIELHKEGGYAPLDVRKASANTFRVMEEGMTFVAKIGGETVGTLALTELPFWYAEETFLQDAWFEVRPQHRNGRVGVALLKAARETATERNKIAFITVNNPDRRQRKSGLVSHTAGFVPIGYTLKLKNT